VHAHVPFSARAEIPFRLHETFPDFQASLAGLNPSPSILHFAFQRIFFRSWSEISAWLAALKFAM